MDAYIAKLLYAGITGDTGRFLYPLLPLEPYKSLVN